MKFKYTALSKDSHKLEGFIDAESEDNAREELHKMDLSVVIINAVSEKEYEEAKKREEEEKKKQAEKEAKKKQEAEKKREEEGIPSVPSTTEEKPKSLEVYLFKAMDKTGKIVDGTIDAFDQFSAYKRLIDEYQFEVQEIYQDKLPEEEKQKIIAEGTEKLKKQLIEEKELEEKKKGGILGLFKTKQKSSEELEEEQEMRLDQESRKLQEAVNKLIKTAEEVVSTYQENLSPDYLEQVKGLVNKLAVLKMSNNFAHINKLSQDLINLINPKDPTHPLYKNKKDIEALLVDEEEKHDKTKLFRGFDSTTNSIISLTKKLESMIQGDQPLPEVQKGEGEEKQEEVAITKKKFTFKELIALIYQPKEESPELIKLTIKKQKLWERIKYLIRLYFVKKEKEEKQEVWEEIKETWSNYKSVKKEVQEEKYKHKHDFEPILKDIRLFITWLLIFYVGYFIIGKIFIDKDFGMQFDFFWQTLNNPVILYIIVSLLIIEAVLTIKIRFFKKNAFAGVILSCVGLFLFTVILINF